MENKKSKNYFCNDEIDRKACQLEICESEDKYYIGKHQVPSLKSIVEKLTGKFEIKSENKQNVIERLHKFLLTGCKDDPLTKKEDPSIWDTKEPYLKTLKNYFDIAGEYRPNTPDIIKSIFKYNKSYEVSEGITLFEKCIECLEKELKYKLEEQEYMEEIARIEEFFTLEALNKIYDILENTEDDFEAERDNIAWYAAFEKIGQYHYHLSKKRTPREDLYFVSKIDIATRDTLYYVATEANVSFLYVTLYLNIQNIDLNKPYLRLLVALPNGQCQIYRIQSFSDEQLDEIITAYKRKEQGLSFKDISGLIESVSIFDRKITSEKVFRVQDYVNQLFYKSIGENSLAFMVFNLFTGFFVLGESQPIKELKAEIVKLFIFVLKNIQKACKKYSIELAYSYFQEAKHLLEIKGQSLFAYGSENFFTMLNLENIMENIIKETSKLSEEFKEEEKGFIATGYYEVKYQSLTLDLKVSETQKRALMQFLDNNLICCNISKSQKISIEKNKVLNFLDIAEEPNKQKNKDKEDKNLKKISQIISIKENKKLKTLSDDVIYLSNLYQKNTNYYGCVDNEEFVNCKILDVNLFYSKKQNVLGEPIPHQLSIKTSIVRFQKEQEFFINIDIYDIKKEKLEKMEEKKRKDIEERIETTNKDLTLFFDTFSIKRGDFNFENWRGRTGIIAIVDEEGRTLKVEEGKGVAYFNENEIF